MDIHLQSPEGHDTAASVSPLQRPDNRPSPAHRVVGDPGGLCVDSTGLAGDSAPNPFDPANLRLSQDFARMIGVKKVLTTVPCRKPNRQEFCRVRPDGDWPVETCIFEDKQNRDVYLVAKPLWAELRGEITPVCLVLAVTKQGDLFLWPCKLPGADGRSNSWNESALAAARLAETKWVRMTANMGGGMYDVYEAAGELAEPSWPDLTPAEILKLCFKDRFTTP